MLSAVDAPFVDSIYGLYVDAVDRDAGDDATNFLEKNRSREATELVKTFLAFY
jgi:hypothetical protein